MCRHSRHSIVHVSRNTNLMPNQADAAVFKVIASRPRHALAHTHQVPRERVQLPLLTEAFLASSRTTRCVRHSSPRPAVLILAQLTLERAANGHNAMVRVSKRTGITGQARARMSATRWHERALRCVLFSPLIFDRRRCRLQPRHRGRNRNTREASLAPVRIRDRNPAQGRAGMSTARRSRVYLR